MNYFQARQRKTDGRWDFTCLNDGQIWPVGYCRPWTDWPEDLKRSGEYERYLRDKDKYHGTGHETREEAERCYRAYLLDTRLRESACPGDEKHLCEKKPCPEWTGKGLSLHGPPNWLCDTHRTRATFEEIHPFEPGMTVISSD